MRTRHFSFSVLILAVVCSPLFGQHVPPMIWDKVEKPNVTVPNPMDRANQRSKTSKTSNVGQSIGGAESEISSVVDNVMAGFAEKDLAKTLRSYWQGPELLVFWDTQEFRGGEAFTKGLQALMDSHQELKLIMENIGIRAFGRFVWLTATYRLESSTGTGPVTHSGRTTWILEGRYNQWKIIHQHFSVWCQG